LLFLVKSYLILLSDGFQQHDNTWRKRDNWDAPLVKATMEMDLNASINHAVDRYEKKMITQQEMFEEERKAWRKERNLDNTSSAPASSPTAELISDITYDDLRPLDIPHPECFTGKAVASGFGGFDDIGRDVGSMLLNIPSPNAGEKRGGIGGILQSISSPNAGERKGGLGGLGLDQLGDGSSGMLLSHSNIGTKSKDPVSFIDSLFAASSASGGGLGGMGDLGELSIGSLNGSMDVMDGLMDTINEPGGSAPNLNVAKSPLFRGSIAPGTAMPNSMGDSLFGMSFASESSTIVGGSASHGFSAGGLFSFNTVDTGASIDNQSAAGFGATAPEVKRKPVKDMLVPVPAQAESALIATKETKTDDTQNAEESKVTEQHAMSALEKARAASEARMSVKENAAAVASDSGVQTKPSHRSNSPPLMSKAETTGAGQHGKTSQGMMMPSNVIRKKKGGSTNITHLLKKKDAVSSAPDNLATTVAMDANASANAQIVPRAETASSTPAKKDLKEQNTSSGEKKYAWANLGSKSIPVSSIFNSQQGQEKPYEKFFQVGNKSAADGGQDMPLAHKVMSAAELEGTMLEGKMLHTKMSAAELD
jgi:hypothetical protein